MTILIYDLVGRDPARPFSPHCWKVALALSHKGLDFVRAPKRFLDLPTVEDGFSKQLPVIRDGERVITGSFDIAAHLEDAYPRLPTLFGGNGGRAAARFLERWAESTLFPYINTVIAMDLYSMQDEANAAYFRETRERNLGSRLEEAVSRREAGLAGFRTSLEPLRSMLVHQPFIGGQTPLFVDHIVFGAFQLSRIASPYKLLEDHDAVSVWFSRCLELYGGAGLTVAPASQRQYPV